MQRKWLTFVAACGDRLAFVEADGLQLQHVREFAGYVYRNRESYSGVGREGLSASFKEQVRYLLPKFVFPRLYENWTGLNETGLNEKCCAFNATIGVNVYKCVILTKYMYGTCVHSIQDLVILSVLNCFQITDVSIRRQTGASSSPRLHRLRFFMFMCVLIFDVR